MNKLLFSLLSSILLIGCASDPKNSSSTPATTPAKPAKLKLGDTEESVRKEGDVKKKPATTLHQPIETVRVAAARALTLVGCKIEENDKHPYFVKGKRPQKMGLFVGSGGETIKIYMLPKGSDTEVWIDTDLSFVGIAGQQNWDKQTMAELDRTLSEESAGTK
jgi:hypothetical protein